MINQDSPFQISKSHLNLYLNHIIGAGEVAQVVEYLPSNHEAFCSNRSTIKTKKQTNKQKKLHIIERFKKVFFLIDYTAK
jgi:hypothetical protein